MIASVKRFGDVDAALDAGAEHDLKAVTIGA